jgi:hypothetical protein
MKRLETDTRLNIFMKIKDLKNEEFKFRCKDRIEFVWLDSSNKLC